MYLNKGPPYLDLLRFVRHFSKRQFGCLSESQKEPGYDPVMQGGGNGKLLHCIQICVEVDVHNLTLFSLPGLSKGSRAKSMSRPAAFRGGIFVDSGLSLTESGHDDIRSRCKAKTGGSAEKDLKQFLLDMDLRRIKTSIVSKFPENVSTMPIGKITTGPYFVQVISIENITQPSYNQHETTTARMLKITMTDGYHKLVGIEYENFKHLSLSTPPGTKVCLSGTIFVRNGKLLLTENHVQILGGVVTDLVESWKLKEQMETARRAGVTIARRQDGGPPPFQIGMKGIKPKSVVSKPKGGREKSAAALAATPNDLSSPEDLDHEVSASFAKKKSTYQGPSLTAMIAGGYVRGVKAAEEAKDKGERSSSAHSARGGRAARGGNRQLASVEEATKSLSSLSMFEPTFQTELAELKQIKGSQKGNMPALIQNMDLLEPSKKHNHGLVLAFTIEDVSGNMARVRADEGLLAHLLSGGTMGMSLANIEKSKTGISFLNAELQTIRPHLINGQLFMFELGDPAKSSDLEHISFGPNDWSVIKQIDEVPTNVLDTLKVKHPIFFRAAGKKKVRDDDKKKPPSQVVVEGGGATAHEGGVSAHSSRKTDKHGRPIFYFKGDPQKPIRAAGILFRYKKRGKHYCLLQRQRHKKTGAEEYADFGGKIEPSDQTAEALVARELGEETNGLVTGGQIVWKHVEQYYDSGAKYLLVIQEVSTSFFENPKEKMGSKETHASINRSVNWEPMDTIPLGKVTVRLQAWWKTQTKSRDRVNVATVGRKTRKSQANLKLNPNAPAFAVGNSFFKAPTVETAKKSDKGGVPKKGKKQGGSSSLVPSAIVRKKKKNDSPGTSDTAGSIEQASSASRKDGTRGGRRGGRGGARGRDRGRGREKGNGGGPKNV